MRYVVMNKSGMMMQEGAKRTEIIYSIKLTSVTY
jgi:hypothetical protein